jgi:hypothetical protein
MSNLGVDNIKGSDGISGPSITGNVVFSGTSHIVLPKGTTAQRPTGVAAGSLRFNTDTKLVEQYNGVEWVTLNSYGVGRGVFGGGGLAASETYTNTIEYITISTTGDVSYFGDLTFKGSGVAACSSSTRGIFWGSQIRTPIYIYTNTIDYITIATTGNSTKFGALSISKGFGASCSSSIRGIFGGGYDYPTTGRFNTLEYITIATTGNVTDFGDLTNTADYPASCSSSTRGIFGSYYNGGYINIIDYITIATTGNATDFGDLTKITYAASACSSSTRGIFAGGVNPALTPSSLNGIDYLTIASTGNAFSFGELTVKRTASSSCSNNTRGIIGGGYNTSTLNSIEYITIASQGSSSNSFGLLSESKLGFGACSDAHGGLS